MGREKAVLRELNLILPYAILPTPYCESMSFEWILHILYLFAKPFAILPPGFDPHLKFTVHADHATEYCHAFAAPSLR